MSALENETTRDTATFEHFGRTWTVPSKVRFSHREKLQANPTLVGICHAFLDAKQLEALREIDPDDAELDKFTDAIAEATGLTSAGNS